MPPCKNDSSSYYKGDEPSPKGLGYSAHAEQIGKIMKGNDGQKYIVASRQNGAHFWKIHKSRDIAKVSKKKLTKTPKKDRPEKKKFSVMDLYPIKKVHTFRNSWAEDLSKDGNEALKYLWKKSGLQKELKSIGVNMYIVPNCLDAEKGFHWSDYPFDAVRDTNSEFMDSPYLIGDILLSSDGKHIVIKDIGFSHGGITHTIKKQLIELMSSRLGARFKWDGSQKRKITINIS